MSAVAVPTRRRPTSRPPAGPRLRPRLPLPTAPTPRPAAIEPEVPAAERVPLVLDVRGDTMPAQAARTLTMLEALEIGRRVEHVNGFVPWSLFALLATRGVRYRILGREPGRVRVLMWRHWAPSGAWPCEPRTETVRTL